MERSLTSIYNSAIMLLFVKIYREVTMKMKSATTLYYVASVCFYILAITKFLQSGFSSGVIWFCLGSAFFCFAVAKQKK